MTAKVKGEWPGAADAVAAGTASAPQVRAVTATTRAERDSSVRTMGPEGVVLM